VERCAVSKTRNNIWCTRFHIVYSYAREGAKLAEPRFLVVPVADKRVDPVVVA
jgi:hypothetical protein